MTTSVARARGGLLWVLVLLVGTACSRERAPIDLGEGAIHATVQGVPAGIGKVVLHVHPQERDDTEQLIVARPEGRGSWSTFAADLPVGRYAISASAFDSESADPLQVQPVLVSGPTQVAVARDAVSRVLLVMTGGVDPGELDLPIITSVTLSADSVEQWEAVAIDVQARGGKEPLVLSGRGPADEQPALRGRFSEPTEMVYDPELEVSEGSLVWEPPKSDGVRTLLLHVEDARGNTAEVAVRIRVGKDFGSADFEVRFYRAPLVSVESKTVNDEYGVRLQAWISIEEDLGRDEPEGIDYVWLHDDCNGVFEEEGAPEEGPFYFNDRERPATMYFSYFVDDADRPAEDRCELHFTITERGHDEEEGAGEGVSRGLRILLPVEELVPITP